MISSFSTYRNVTDILEREKK